MPTTICSSCSTRLESNDLFCAVCGSQRPADDPTPPFQGTASPMTNGRRCPSCDTSLNQGDHYCPGCGAVSAPKPSPRPRNRAPILVGISLTALVALTLFVWTQHQAIIAQSLADQARHQQNMAQQALLQAPAPLPPPSPAPVVLTPVPVYVPPTTAQSNGEATGYPPPTSPDATTSSYSDAAANSQEFQSQSATLLARQSYLMNDRQEATSFEKSMEYGQNGHLDPGTLNRIADDDQKLADVQTQLAQVQSEQAQSSQH